MLPANAATDYARIACVRRAYTGAFWSVKRKTPRHAKKFLDRRAPYKDRPPNVAPAQTRYTVTRGANGWKRSALARTPRPSGRAKPRGAAPASIVGHPRGFTGRSRRGARRVIRCARVASGARVRVSAKVDENFFRGDRAGGLTRGGGGRILAPVPDNSTGHAATADDSPPNVAKLRLNPLHRYTAGV